MCTQQHVQGPEDCLGSFACIKHHMYSACTAVTAAAASQLDKNQPELRLHWSLHFDINPFNAWHAVTHDAPAWMHEICASIVWIIFAVARAICVVLSQCSDTSSASA
jgi:hypothetical protein